MAKLQNEAETVKFIFHDPVAQTHLPMTGTLVQLGATKYRVTGMDVEDDFDLEAVEMAEAIVMVDKRFAAEGLYSQAAKRFKPTVLPKVTKLLGTSARYRSYSYRELNGIQELILELPKALVDRLMAEQVPLNEEGIFIRRCIRDGGRPSDGTTIIWVPKSASLKATLEKARRLDGVLHTSLSGT